MEPNRIANPAQVFGVMRDVLASEFEMSGDQVKPEAHLVDDLDLDSLDVISLAQEIGDAIGVGIEEDDVRDCRTLGDLADRVAARISS